MTYCITGTAEVVDKSKAGTTKERKEKKERDGDEFDMFAQSRNATYETTKNRYNMLSYCIIKLSIIINCKNHTTYFITLTITSIFLYILVL